MLDLCNGIVKEGCIPENWKSSVVLPIYKGKGDPMECGCYSGIKLLERAMKVVERIFEHRIRPFVRATQVSRYQTGTRSSSPGQTDGMKLDV